MSEGWMERETGGWVKEELSWKVKLSIYQSIYVSILSYDQVAEMSFLCWLSGAIP